MSQIANNQTMPREPLMVRVDVIGKRSAHLRETAARIRGGMTSYAEQVSPMGQVDTPGAPTLDRNIDYIDQQLSSALDHLNAIERFISGDKPTIQSR